VGNQLAINDGLQEEGNKLDDRQKISDWHTEIFGDHPRRLFFVDKTDLVWQLAHYTNFHF
jgi:hypothetical protein